MIENRRALAKVLAIAGSDSSGGAGIQADVKSITALGAHAATAITAITVQDSSAVHAVHLLQPSLVATQIERALVDPGADAVKIGMLGDASITAAVAATMRARGGLPLVIDPVVAASSGARLLTEDALDLLCRELFPLATLITPNVPEAALLSGIVIHDLRSMERAARALVPTGGTGMVLVKGGHLPGAMVVDVLASRKGIVRFEAARLPGPPRRGTGCTLASAIAAGIAQGLALEDSIRRARAYVRAAIATAPDNSRGAGLLNHAVTFDPERIEPFSR